MIYYKRTYAYDTRVVPLLHRMSALEKLTISLYVVNRTSFIDDHHLNNEIQSRMPHLSIFIFNILMHDVSFLEDDRRTFIEGISFDCYVDYVFDGEGRCHIYSLPLPLTHFHGITNNSPGDQFIHVRNLYVIDAMYPFEHEFFQRITRSFPLLQSLTAFNRTEQKRARQCSSDEQVSSPVEYSHLIKLDLEFAHIDYVEQFLIDTRIYLPRLNSLRVQYEHLTTVTKNFTNNATRLNCGKVKRLITEKAMVHSNDVYLYFPSW